MNKKARNLLTHLLTMAIILSSFAGLAIPASAADEPEVLTGIAALEAAEIDMSAYGILPLKDVFADNFLIGTTLGTDAHKRYHYNAMTPENNPKPHVIWPNPTSAAPATSYRTTVTSANSYDIFTIGHALNWQNQSNRWPDRTQISGSSDGRPTWNATTGLFTPVEFFWSYNNPDPELSVNAQLERYIKGISEVFPVGETYAFDAWDVINEAIRDNPEHPEDWRNALRRGDMPMMRPGNWYGSYAQGGNGWDMVYDSFRFARKYFPNTILNYNEFNDEELPNKAIAVAEMVKELNARYAEEYPEDPNMLIGMIGIQAHYNTRLDLDNLEKVINIYMETGVPIELTELDVSIPKPSSGFTTAEEQDQARFYARLFRLLTKYSDYIHRVSWWGAADNANWRSTFSPMLFTTTSGNTVDGVNRGTPKEAYWATLYPELYLGIPKEPPVLESFDFGDNSVDVGLSPEYDVNVPNGVSSISFGADDLVFGEDVDADDVDISVTLSNNGVVKAGEPCVATVNLRWKDSPNNKDNTTTYTINFGHMSAEWIRDWNYPDTGYRSAVNVRFSDGETALTVAQEFVSIANGEVVLYNSKTFEPLPKNGKGTFAVSTGTQLSDEYLASVTLNKSVLNAGTEALFMPVYTGHLGTPDNYWKLTKDPIEVSKTYIIVSSNSGLALTHEGRSSVAAGDGITSAVRGYFGTEVVTENDIITKTFVAANKIESPIQDHLRFWIKPLTHPNPGQYTKENGYTGFGLQSLVHGGLIQPYFIFRSTGTANTIQLNSDTHIRDVDLDRGVWFHTPIDPETGETTIFLYTPGDPAIYYGLASNDNGFVAERIMDIDNPGDVFKVKLYEYVTNASMPDSNLTVTFDTNGGTDLVNPIKVAFGAPYGELPVPADRLGFLFKGWSIDGTPEGIVTAETIVGASHKLTAVWEVDPNAAVSLTGSTALTIKEEAEYILRVGNVSKLATVTVWLEVDGEYLNARDAIGLNGFDVLDRVSWINTEGSIWTGRVTLANLDGSLTSDEYADILKMTFGLNKLGETTVKVTDVKLSGYDENDDAIFIDATIKNGIVDLEIVEWYSVYDLNRDKSVDQLDLTIAQRYFAARDTDDDWSVSKIADVNGDGEVDIQDLILILNNIVW